MFRNNENNEKKNLLTTNCKYKVQWKLQQIVITNTHN